MKKTWYNCVGDIVMGCDIHFYVEKLEDGEWVSADRWSKNKWGEDEDELTVYYEDRFWQGRNYDLFAILADVRNGYGFAGCDTGNGYVPISPPRGLPDDVCESVQKESDRWGCDGHSHSWLTVQDLLDYDWDQTTKKRGMVSPEESKLLRETGKAPEAYCGWTNQANFETVEWDRKYRDEAPYFLNTTLPRLQELGPPDEVRIVFWFDN
jgi:hypothetical protein